MRVKVLKEQTVEWKEFDGLRGDTPMWNDDIQTRFYKGMEYLHLAHKKIEEAAVQSGVYRRKLINLNGGNLGEAHVYDEKVWAKIEAVHQALESIETLAKDIDPCWTMSRGNYHFKKGDKDGSE